MSKEAEGVKCECGEFTPFGLYVAAHWRERLDFTCPKCQARYTVQAGKVKPKKKSAKKPRR